MDQGLAGSGAPRRYGATDGVPGVAFAGGLGGGLAGGGLAGDSNVSQFSPTELYNLCENIRASIITITKGRKMLEKELRSIGTPKDTQELRDQIHVTHVCCNEVVAQTTQELARLTEVVRRGDKKQKLQSDRLRDDFSAAVTDYGSAQKKISDKMKMHSPVKPVAFLDPDLAENDTERMLDAERQQQLQKQVQRDLEFEAGLLEERTQRIQAIENDIIDVNKIMQDLSEMLHGQEEMIGATEQYVDNALNNVEEGTQAIRKAAEYQRKYRRKVIILLVIAAVVLAVLGIIIYVSVKR